MCSFVKKTSRLKERYSMSPRVSWLTGVSTYHSQPVVITAYSSIFSSVRAPPCRPNVSFFAPNDRQQTDNRQTTKHPLRNSDVTCFSASFDVVQTQMLGRFCLSLACERSLGRWMLTGKTRMLKLVNIICRTSVCYPCQCEHVNILIYVLAAVSQRETGFMCLREVGWFSLHWSVIWTPSRARMWLIFHCHPNNNYSSNYLGYCFSVNWRTLL